MPTVLISAPYMLQVLPRFRQAFEHFGLEVLLLEVEERLSEADLLSIAGTFDGAICGDDPFTAAVLDACTPRLKVISKWGTGIDSIDQAAAARLGVAVRNTRNAFSQPVADSVLGYVLAFARRQPWLDQAMKRGDWEKLPGRSLNECTLGVIGVGNIGKATLRRAMPFEMRLLGNDIVQIDPEFVSSTGVEMVELAALLQQSDFVSLNCDLNPTSHHLIHAGTLKLMRPSAVLINTARGPLVDEAALVDALQSGALAGAALDVFEIEPLPVGSPLRSMDNVMLAPHNANSSPEAWERVHINTIRNLLEGLGIQAEGLAQIV